MSMSIAVHPPIAASSSSVGVNSVPITLQHMASPDAGLPGNIGAPATRALTGAGYTRLSQLANVPASELKKLHGVGPKALRLLREALEEHGMSLG
jgi:hypothetical protein